MIEALGLPHNAAVLDVGCGSGWTSLFLAEAGFSVTGYDLVPANVELARRRAERWGCPPRFEVAEHERLPPGDRMDAILLFDALHHSTRQSTTLRSVAGRAPADGCYSGGPRGCIGSRRPRA